MSAVAMSESQLMSCVRSAARVGGWFVYHTHDSRRSDAGFPDLVMVHPVTGRLVFSELKSAKGRLRPEQHEWINALCRGAHEAVIWRPEDWQSGTIQAALLSERKAA